MKKGKLLLVLFVGGALFIGLIFLRRGFDGDGTPAPEAAAKIPEARSQTVRVLSRAIPAPRGMIADRNGRVMAGNREAYTFALQFPQFSDEVTEEEVLNWSHLRLEQMAKFLGREVIAMTQKGESEFPNHED